MGYFLGQVDSQQRFIVAFVARHAVKLAISLTASALFMLIVCFVGGAMPFGLHTTLFLLIAAFCWFVVGISMSDAELMAMLPGIPAPLRIFQTRSLLTPGGALGCRHCKLIGGIAGIANAVCITHLRTMC